MRKFNAVLAADPTNERALAHRASLYNLIGRQDLALDDIDHAIALNDRSAFSFAVRALISQHTSGQRQVLEDLDRAIELIRHPETPLRPEDTTYAAFDNVDRGYVISVAFTLRAELKAQRKQYAAALADADAIIDLDPSMMSAWVVRASIERAQYRFEAALADDTKAMSLPDHGEGPVIGLCGDYAALGLESLASRRCNEAIAVFPLSPRARTDRGVMYLKAGDFHRAVTDFDAALLKLPKLGIAIYGRGLSRIAAGDTMTGEADLKAAMQEDPDSAAWFQARGLKAPTMPRT